jgi:hypothetical protein
MTEPLTTLPEPPLFQVRKDALDAIGNADVASLEKYMELHERHQRNEAAERLAAALTKFQGKCPQITKRRKINLGGGDGPLYASLDDIMREISPLLAECGLCVTFSAEIADNGFLRATCNVRHGRHVEASHITLPVPAQMKVNDTQKMAAALSYAKRHSLCAALNIIVTDEDNDAGGMVEAVTEEQIATLREWFQTSGEGPGPTLKFCKVKAPHEIPAAMFPVIVERFNRKYARS